MTMTIERRSKPVNMGPVTDPTTRTPRRRDALSPERIVDTAIEILDRDGEDALTFKALTTRLHTGAGAIYHHVANKAELLAAATDQIIGQVLQEIPEHVEPVPALRAISLGLFDAIDAHPWLGAQLPRNPLPAVIRIWTAIARQLQDLGITGTAAANAGAALVNYILGSAAQYTAGARTASDDRERAAYLNALSEHWTHLHPGSPADAADALRDHDDRAQFLAGVEILLTGITNHRRL
jgi:AcrR family transcriptional regulator